MSAEAAAIQQTPVDVNVEEDVKRNVTATDRLSTQDTEVTQQETEDGSLLDPEDLLILGFNISSNESMEKVVEHFQSFGDIASFSPLDGCLGACVLIGYANPDSAAAAAAAAPLVVEEKEVVIMQHADFANGQLSSDKPHEVTISGLDANVQEADLERLKAHVATKGNIVSWKVIQLVSGPKIVRMAMDSLDAVAAMFQEPPFMFEDTQLYLISEDHLALAPQAHIVVFGGPPSPPEEDLHKLKEYFEMFGEISQMFVRNEPEGLMLLISYMSEEAMYKLGACEKHAPLGDELMIQCVKSEVFDKLCSDDFQFDMENAQDRIVVCKGMPAEGQDLSQETFETICDTFKAHLEGLIEDVNIVKIDMEPAYNITIVEFYADEEAQKIAALKNVEFDNKQLTVQMFGDFVVENVIPKDAQKEDAAVTDQEQPAAAVENQQID